MYKWLFGFILLSMSTLGFGFDIRDVGKDVGSKASPDFKYTYTREDVSDSATKVFRDSEDWISVKSGHLSVGTNWKKMDKLRLGLAANAGQLAGLSETDFGKATLNHLQIEVGAETAKPTYVLFGVELKNFFLASVHNSGGMQRLILGPMIYYSNSYSMLLWMPKTIYYGEGKDAVDANTTGTVVLRNRIREFDNWVKLDVDVSYRWLKDEDAATYLEKNLGYSAGLGLWKVWGRYSYMPYWEGTRWAKETYQVSYETSL